MDAEERAILERFAVALERIAEHFAPLETQRLRRPAVLSNATYTPEERRRKEIRETLGGQKPQPPR